MSNKSNKLIRDRIPEIITKTGKPVKVTQLSGQDFVNALQQKLKEEVEEFLAAQTDEEAINELVDIQEVLDYLVKEKQLSPSAFAKLQTKKRRERGGFEKRLKLVELRS